MKKFLLVLLLVLALFASSCGRIPDPVPVEGTEPTQGTEEEPGTDSTDPTTKPTPQPTPQEEAKPGTETVTIPEQNAFDAVITEVNQNNIRVTPVENSWILSSADDLYVSAKDVLARGFLKGDTVTITFDGLIMESYPAQISAETIVCKSNGISWSLTVEEEEPEPEQEPETVTVKSFECTVESVDSSKKLALVSVEDSSWFYATAKQANVKLPDSLTYTPSQGEKMTVYFTEEPNTSSSPITITASQVTFFESETAAHPTETPETTEPESPKNPK